MLNDNDPFDRRMTYFLFAIAVMVLVLSCVGCSTLAPIAGGALGGGVGSILSPVGGAVGAGIGVATAQMAFPSEDGIPVDNATALALAQTGKPLAGTTASTIHETKSLVFELGWWYLLIFILVPFISKRGRGWIKGIGNARNNVCKSDLDQRVRELIEEKENE